MQFPSRRFIVANSRFVLAGIVLLFVSASAFAQASSDQPVVNKAAALKFASIPNAPACITIAVERGDPAAGPSVMLAKFAPGCAVPWHWHIPNEHVMGVSGVLRVEMKDGKPAMLGAKDFGFMPGHHIHRATCIGSAPCFSYLYSDGPFDIHYVDKAGNEISLADAMKRKGSR
jgi:quercetin dioxygenase-like cupin family protein